MNGDIASILKTAEKGISEYLQNARDSGRIDRQLYDDAIRITFPNLKEWMNDPHIDRVSPMLKKGVSDKIKAGKWEEIVNAYRQSVRFGTGGIRGMMAYDKESILKMKKEGIATDILKGPNTINDLVFLLTSAGVAKFGNAQKPRLDKIVIGYDSRIRGFDFARIVAELFLHYGYTVYFFDAPCPYPEVTFAIPNDSVKADIGVLISASHNDYRYNGYKLSCSNGSQFDPEERDRMYNEFIVNAKPEDIQLRSFKEAEEGKLWFLGGDTFEENFDYGGKEKYLINMHEKHRDHNKKFLYLRDLEDTQKKSKDPLKIAFCPFHGSGNMAVRRLLSEVGFIDVKPVNGKLDLYVLDGMFPSFRNDPGKEQQPDPGDPRSAKVAVEAFFEDYPEDGFDILIGTDPDADRCGIVVVVPEEQRHLYKNQKYYLLSADDVWTLVLWYRLNMEKDDSGKVKDAEKKFLVLSHTTSDSITSLAGKYGIGVVKSWVGFAALAAVTRDVWNGKGKDFIGLVDGRNERYKTKCHPFACDSSGLENGKRSINIGALEQSNGFSILGGPPPDERSLGEGGHVRDKDGTFAALLVAEIAAWAKEKGTNLIELLDKNIYLDPDIGLFMSFYEPDPLDGEYPGIEGDRIKKKIIRRALGYYQLALAGDLEIAGEKVIAASIFRTGKYDEIYPPDHDFQFPDEGIRYYISENKLEHITVRPSGTGNSMRFHIQLHENPSESELLASKERLRRRGLAIMDDLRVLLKAPRETA
ncbi:MAG: hypothetical protein V3W18_14740 [candidate division Zixibacteria bacterium]